MAGRFAVDAYISVAEGLGGCCPACRLYLRTRLLFYYRDDESLSVPESFFVTDRGSELANYIPT